MYERIVVPLDGSPLAERALPHAVNLAKLSNATLHLLRIVDFTRLDQYGPYGLAVEYTAYEPVLAEEEATARDYLQQVQDRLSDSGVQITTDVRRGPVTREIVGIAAEGDVIVMASHGRGGISRWLLGSVAEDVVRNSMVPVMLIRAQDREDNDASRNPAR
jgi:nucleotide-binding universal stress UspA family protein